jgi:hypothetical protein
MKYAFKNCNNLTTIKCLSKRPPKLQDSTVFSIPNNITVKVPHGSLRKYISSGWNKFFENRIVEDE